jgi:hypothetical protein
MRVTEKRGTMYIICLQYGSALGTTRASLLEREQEELRIRYTIVLDESA